ncbi:MAG TPA: DUF4907 domain-containing protein, partial [Saprospiraceae bacterium]
KAPYAKQMARRASSLNTVDIKRMCTFVIMKYDFILYLFILVSGCTNAKQPVITTTNQDTVPVASIIDDSTRIRLMDEKKQLSAKMAVAQLTYFIIHVPNEEFGYTIFIDGQMYIEQKTIPALPGNHGFASKEDAEKIARLAIEKIKQGEMPPTISVDDLKANGITQQP